MQHQMKCVYIREVCTHHECVHCSSFEVAHATYHIHTYIHTYIHTNSMLHSGKKCTIEISRFHAQMNILRCQFCHLRVEISICVFTFPRINFCKLGQITKKTNFYHVIFYIQNNKYTHKYKDSLLSVRTNIENQLLC